MDAPHILRIIEDALLHPVGEGDGFTGLCDFSPDRASESVLARGVYRALWDAGVLSCEFPRV